MSAAIYSFYEEGYVTESNVNKSSSVTKLCQRGVTYTYVCKFCKEKNYKTKEGNIVTANATFPTTSNLIAHLQRVNHVLVYDKYLLAQENQISVSKKRLLFETNTPERASKVKQSLLFDNGVISVSKYSAHSFAQKQRFILLYCI